jgi:CheY-like chemotaxis protein
VLWGKERSYKGLMVSDIPRASTPVPQGTKPRATKILLVEDSLANRDMLTRRLQRRGFVVCSAADGPTGVAMSVSEKPDLILMDVALGAMDGWQATQLIKDDLRTSHIPIIALTAHALATDREKSVEVGCADFDTKPVDLTRLLGKIEVCLARTRR